MLGIGSIAKAATVGKVGGLAMLYFLVMSTLALGIGLLVGNIIHPGEGLELKPYEAGGSGDSNATVDFLMSLIPVTSLCCQPWCWRCLSASRCREWARPVSRY